MAKKPVYTVEQLPEKLEQIKDFLKNDSDQAIVDYRFINALDSASLYIMTAQQKIRATERILKRLQKTFLENC